MDISEAIKSRRSARSYKAKKVPDEKIRELISLAKFCPSARNLQPLKFIVASSSKAISEISKDVQEEGEKDGMSFRDSEDPIFYGAPAVIFIIAPEDSKWAVHDGCIAASTLMLAAVGMGLATCSIGYARYLMARESARKTLGIPEGFQLVYTLTLGYPEEAPQMPEKKEPEITFV